MPCALLGVTDEQLKEVLQHRTLEALGWILHGVYAKVSGRNGMKWSLGRLVDTPTGWEAGG